MARANITISDDLFFKIKDYAEIRKLRFSKAIEELAYIGLDTLNDKKNYELQMELFNKILGNEKYITILLEQFYSDMYMEAKTNPKNNEGLKTIKNKFYKKDFDD